MLFFSNALSLCETVASELLLRMKSDCYLYAVLLLLLCVVVCASFVSIFKMTMRMPLILILLVCHCWAQCRWNRNWKWNESDLRAKIMRGDGKKKLAYSLHTHSESSGTRWCKTDNYMAQRFKMTMYDHRCRRCHRCSRSAERKRRWFETLLDQSKEIKANTL